MQYGNAIDDIIKRSTASDADIVSRAHIPRLPNDNITQPSASPMYTKILRSNGPTRPEGKSRCQE